MNDYTYTDQMLNIGVVRRFLTRQESILLFFALTGALAILFVVFGQPTSVLGFIEQRSSLSPLGQVTISFVSGFGVLVMSRELLWIINRWHELTPVSIGIWLILEMLLCVSVMALVLWAVSGAGTMQLAMVVGDLVLGVIAIQVVPYVVTYLLFRLHESREEIARLRQVIEKHDAALIPPADSKVNFYAKGGRMSFSTKMSNVLYIEAADNYVNIHYLNDGKEDTFILHNSLKEIEKHFVGSCLIRCHRGYMVNVDNVNLMRKENLGIILELNQCAKVIPVSKSYTAPVIQYFASNTDLPLPNEK